MLKPSWPTLCCPLQARTISNSQENLVILSDLEADTRYCVQAVIITRNPNPSEASRAVCERTGHSRWRSSHPLSAEDINESN